MSWSSSSSAHMILSITLRKLQMPTKRNKTRVVNACVCERERERECVCVCVCVRVCARARVWLSVCVSPSVRCLSPTPPRDSITYSSVDRSSPSLRTSTGSATWSWTVAAAAAVIVFGSNTSALLVASTRHRSGTTLPSPPPSVVVVVVLAVERATAHADTARWRTAAAVGSGT